MKSRSAVMFAAAVLAVVGTAFVNAPAASASERFAAVTTEEFCAPGVTCGTAVTSLGPATVRTVITSFFPLPSGCFHDEHTTTLTYADDSTLVLAIVGTLCPFPVVRFTGTYSVAGGTGQFIGATGSGFDRATRPAVGPIRSQLVGDLALPN